MACGGGITVRRRSKVDGYRLSYHYGVLVPVSFLKVPYRTITFLYGTLNDTNFWEVII